MVTEDFYELSVLFVENDFPKAAAIFFHNLGFIDKPEIVSRSTNSKLWIYELIGYETFLLEEERHSLELIEEASELRSVYFKKYNVQLLAIVLSPYANRSQTAYQIQKVVSKGTGRYSIILFSQKCNGRRECMFSVDSGKDIILSDWFSVDDNVDKLLGIAAPNLTCSSAGEFVRDFAYHIGRSYYGCYPRHAMRFELLQYASQAYQMPDGTYDWYRLHDDAEKLQYQDVYKYGDDFVEPCPGDGNVSEDQGLSADILFADIPATPKPEAIPEVYSASAEERAKDETDLLIEQLGGSLLNPIELLAALERKQAATQVSGSLSGQTNKATSTAKESPSNNGFATQTQTIEEVDHTTSDGGMYSLFSEGMLSEETPLEKKEQKVKAAVNAKSDMSSTAKQEDEAESEMPLESDDVIQQEDAIDEILSNPISKNDLFADEIDEEPDYGSVQHESELMCTRAEEDLAEKHISHLKEELHQIGTLLEEQIAKQSHLNDKQKALELEVKKLEKSKSFSFSRAWRRLTSAFSRGKNAQENTNANLEKAKRELLVNKHQLELLKEEIERQTQEKNRIERELKNFEN